MKTRTGFVSNSSSSSFIVYGFCINGSRNDILRKDMQANPESFWETYMTSDWVQENVLPEMNEEAASEGLSPFTIDNFFDEDHIDMFMDIANDNDVFEEVTFGGYDVSSSENDDDVVVGVYLGSCDYGISTVCSDIEKVIAEHKEPLSKLANGKKLKMYSVYTGY